MQLIILNDLEDELKVKNQNTGSAAFANSFYLWNFNTKKK